MSDLFSPPSSPPQPPPSSPPRPRPSLLQPPDLGSVASSTGHPGPRSVLYSGNLELTSVLEVVKRLLERYCYRVCPFIASAEEMIDIINRLWPEANRQKRLNVDFNLHKVHNIKYIKSGYYSMQSSWISSARNTIADLYDLNEYRSAADRLAAVNELLDHAFIYRDSDRSLPLARRVTPFFASQIPRFIRLHFFNKSRIHNAGLHD
ncbi:hypothetical protein BZA05DRAFT_118135 [Tricharina praecox]|uniref:uncharacterized protein n=1 Tax=Tricharina praecox TaxID=43433 RepID=UPI00221E4CB2|nr:uncharacterized protein BZA05DRAFT_118135 [Tricharina praecox]KAI5848027.1 hypothetical protein BZA05DRAFT_118135 [Tricharina praecox]